MKRFLPLVCAAAATVSMQAQYVYVTSPDSLGVPERAIIVTGSADIPQARDHIAVLYSREDLAFDDPSAPRFLFLDKQGKVAMGIGGYLKGTAMYDMDGAVNSNGFATSSIPVPFDPAQRNRLGADVSHSTLFLKLVARSTKVGRVIVYLQTNFTGDKGYGLKLKQAYMSVGNVTMGLARSTFSDGPSQAPTVDVQGPSGQITAKNILVQYSSPSYKGFSYAASVELPVVGCTSDGTTAAIAQRFPDIPVYVQYSWAPGNHIRLSGLLRRMSYRDLTTSTNHFTTGWGTQISTIAKIYGGLHIFGHVSYGKGISHYINDLSDMNNDLVASPDEPGKMIAPATLTYTGGLQYNFSKNFFMSAAYSQARLYDTEHMAGSTYKFGRYIDVNAFYNITGDLRVGLEYIHGNRKDISGAMGQANRVDAMLQYSF